MQSVFFFKQKTAYEMRISDWSSDVYSSDLTLTGQTQFVLGNGGRLLLDGAGSHAKAAGEGFAGGASYQHFFDRGGLTDSFPLRPAYVSPKFATLRHHNPVHSTSFSG